MRVVLTAALFASSLVACSPAPSAQLIIRVEGPGSVRLLGGGTLCDAGTCALRLDAPVGIVAVAGPGAQFVGWEGACIGLSQTCAGVRGGEVTAHFSEYGILSVSVSGPGSVAARGTVFHCSVAETPCRWEALSELEFVATPEPRAAFLGYSGDCSGMACRLKSGVVRAAFVADAGFVQVRFLGTGSGVVTVGDSSCDAGCRVPIPLGAGVAVRAEPDETSFFDGFGGVCTGATCSVAQEGIVDVRFDRGSVLRVVAEGSGGGELSADGQPCDAGGCQLLLRSFGAVPVTARADEESTFRGFSGACAVVDAGHCLASADAGTVRAHFDSVLQWVRSFPVNSIGLNSTSGQNPNLEDGDGFWSAITFVEEIEFEGTTYRLRSGSGSNVLVAKFLWDGGVDSVTSLIPPDGGPSLVGMWSLVTTGDGGVWGFGFCQASVAGVPCQSSSYVARIDRNGLQGLRVFDGGAYGAFVTGLRWQHRLVLSFGEGGRSGARTGIYFVDDPLLDTPQPFATGGHSAYACQRSSTSELSCRVGAVSELATGPCLDTSRADGFAMVVFSANGTCRELARGTPPTSPRPFYRLAYDLRGEGEVAVQPLALSTGWFTLSDGTIIDSPRNAVVWIDAGDGGIAQVSLDPMTAPASASFLMPTDVQRYGVGHLIGLSVTGRSPAYFGRDLRDAGFALSHWDAAHQLSRMWIVRGVPVGFEAGGFSVLDAGVVVHLVGRDLTFGGHRLAPDSRDRHHVLLLRE